MTKVSGRQEESLSGMSALDLFNNNEPSLKNLIFSLTTCPEILRGLTSALSKARKSSITQSGDHRNGTVQ